MLCELLVHPDEPDDEPRQFLRENPQDASVSRRSEGAMRERITLCTEQCQSVEQLVQIAIQDVIMRWPSCCASFLPPSLSAVKQE